MPAPLLELKDIQKSYGSQRILKGISLSIFPGEFVTFLGPSGCGKTTTLRMIGGFDRPDAGSVHLGGVDVTDWPPYRRNVHTVFQHYALFPHLSVYENVAFSLRIDNRPEEEVRAKVGQALELVHLAGFGSRRPDQLSGGQQQRVALARAIVGRPSLLLLDEPLGALDLKLRRAMQMELKAIQRRLQIAFLYVTHDQEEALTLSDRIAVFKAGEIVQVDTPRAIYEKPRSSFVADFIGSANILRVEVLRNSGLGLRLRLEGEIEIPLGSDLAVPIAVGAQAVVAVRPERIGVHRNRPSAASVGEIAFPARLEEVVYLGSATQYVLAPFSTSRKVLTAVAPQARGEPSQREPAQPGEPVWIEMRPEDLTVLEEAA